MLLNKDYKFWFCSIARSIAEGHRGAISARTEGDTITFTALLK